jgi:hypothetical protein
MKHILIITLSTLMLAGCAATYDGTVKPKATASLKQEIAGCKARWTAKAFSNYSEWQACELASERGFATTISLTKMDAFEAYAADMRILAADRDAKRLADPQVFSRAEEIRGKFFADCSCKLAWVPVNQGPSGNSGTFPFVGGPPNPSGGFMPSAGPNAAQHTPLP